MFRKAIIGQFWYSQGKAYLVSYRVSSTLFRSEEDAYNRYGDASVIGMDGDFTELTENYVKELVPIS